MSPLSGTIKVINDLRFCKNTFDKNVIINIIRKSYTYKRG